MKAPCSGSQARALLPIYMVAGSYWCPILRAGGIRVDPWTSRSSIAVRMTDANKSSNAAFTLFPGEQPKTHEVKEWWKVTKPIVTPDQLALYNGTRPRGLLDYTPASVPVALVAAADGPTESAVQSRHALIMAIEDSNSLKITKEAAHKSEMLQSLFNSIDAAVRPKAPLLMAKLERECKQTGGYTECFDGAKALKILIAMGEVAAMKPGEENAHEAHLLALSFSPLPPGSTTEQFSQRVTDALENDIPFLSRKPTEEWISEWVINQAPREHAIEVRGMYNRLSDAEKKDSHAVAAKVIDIIAAAVDPLLALKEGLRKAGVNEFIGIVDGPGRRPHGMGSAGKGSGKGGKGSGSTHGAGAGSSGGKGGGKGGKGSSQRHTCCSVPPPLGPMCDRAHPPPCWRDPRESPVIPKRLCDNTAFMSDLTKDRLENANRIGVASHDVQCGEVIGVLTDIDYSQWPFAETDDVLDVPPELVSEADEYAKTQAERDRSARLAKLEIDLARERALNALLIDETSAMALDEAASKAYFITAVVTLLATGLGGDVPNLDSFKANTMKVARRKLEEVNLSYDDLTDGQVKCTAWLLLYAQEAAVVTGGEMRRYAYGLIRLNVHALIDSWRMAQPATVAPVPFEMAIGRVVPLFTKAVEEAREIYKRAGGTADGLIELDITILSGPAPDEVALWAPAVFAEAFEPSASLRQEIVASSSTEIETTHAEMLPLVGTPVSVDGLPRRVLVDYRVNLTVPYSDRDACEHSGGLFDQVNGVLFVPPRVDLKPFEKWLPFEIESAGRPGVLIAAAGPTKADGSPNMSMGANIRVRNLLKSPEPMRALDGGVVGEAARPPSSPVAPDAPETEGVVIAAQLRAAAAAIAPMLAWIFVVMALALFHENIMTAVNVVGVLAGHAYIATVGGLWGGDDLTLYTNVSIFELATTPGNVMVQAFRGDIVSQAVLSSLVIVLVAYSSFFGRMLRRVWDFHHRLVNHHTVIAMLLAFIWMCVVRASAVSAPSLAAMQHRGLLPDIADRCGGSHFVRFNIRCAHAVTERVYSIAHIDFALEEELIAILGIENAMSACVWDTGARRHVVRSTDRMIKGSIRPCNFTVRGINTGGMQPQHMGDVEAFLPLRGGTVERCVLKGAVCIEQSPHDIISSCLLENDGVCDWRGFLPDGREVYLENHRFLLMPNLRANQTSHDFDAEGNGVIFEGKQRGLDRASTLVTRDHSGRPVNATYRPLRRGQHWSKSVHADVLGKMDLGRAEEYMRELREANEHCMAHGPSPSTQVAASHYVSRGPFVAQLIEELSLAARVKKAKAKPRVRFFAPGVRMDDPAASDWKRDIGATSTKPSDLIYWFSGTNLTETGVSARWAAINGGSCVYRETKLNANDSLLSNAVFNVDMAAFKKGNTNGLFAIPCSTFTVSRFRLMRNIRPLRTAQHILGLPNLKLWEQAMVNVSNILVRRTCEAARAITAAGGVWVIENPVRRNDTEGPWRRFASGKFPEHGSLWQMPDIVDLARSTGARVVHFPLCYFEHDDPEGECDIEQKYISLMYSPELETALGFLRSTRCTHKSHGKVAVGFDLNGVSHGARTATYPAELNRILARAIAFPSRCASDAGWSNVDSAIVEMVSNLDDGVPPLESEIDSVADAPLGRGIVGDRRGNSSGARVARGHAVNMRQLSSRQVHETFVHKPVEVLREMPTVCDDVPSDWANLLDLNETCPDCLAGKHTHFGSHSGLPEVTKPGEIVAYDLLILRTPDLYTSGTIIFGAIDLYSDWDVIIKIKFKTDVPECLREVVRIFKAHGHDVQRMHTDGEAIFHSEEAFGAVKNEMDGIGCLVTTGADYDHRQNSKIERHFRRLGDDARPGFLQSKLDDKFYQCALVDASAKHKLLPLARVPGQSPTTMMTGKPGKALPHRPFGSLGYVMLEHELNDSTTRLNKAHARAEPAILLSYGVTGVLRDRRVPAWTLHVPALRRNVTFVTPHATIVLGCYPGAEGLQGGLDNVLRQRSDVSGDNTVHLDVNDTGEVTISENTLVPEFKTAAPSADSPATNVIAAEHHAEPLAPAEPTIAQRLSRRVPDNPYEGDNRVLAQLDFEGVENKADDSVLLLEENTLSLRGSLSLTSLHSAVGGVEDPKPFEPTLANAPWLYSPRGGGANDEAILMADLDVEQNRLEETVLLCDDSADDDLRALNTVRRHVTQEAPRRVVRFPWGDCPTPWVDGYSTVYDTGIDDAVFVLEECVLTSLTSDDDPPWEQASKGNDSQSWFDAADGEKDNLERFGVFLLVPADSVPADEDIFDTMLLCKVKRGQANCVVKNKVRCVLCGNQVIASAKRGVSKTTVDLRTHSPAVRSSSLKCNFAVGVLDDMRMLDFDIDAAYLQGRYIDRRVFARAPKYFREYDERGVEYVWHLQRALYGGPDSGRVWYNTFAHALMKEETITVFQRCHFEPCTFTHFIDGQVDKNGRPQRIVCSVYVDDGRTWDNCNQICDKFYKRLRDRFSITMGAGTQFTIGMDIASGEGWLKIFSSTYIMNMCERWLEYPIAEYDYVGTPGHPKLLDLYETAFLTRGNTPSELGTRYRSLVGALIFPAPTTRSDCLYVVGILARAMDCATEDMFKAALHCLVFMGQTHNDGITYVRDAPFGRRYVHWSDSDWAVRRSTSGGTGQLAGASVQAMSRKQDCVSGSTTHAEIIAASANSNDVVWARGYLGEIGLPQDDEPSIFNVDAANVITLVHNFISSKMTRHITRRECIVRERESDGTLAVTKVPTADNLADLFTKSLARDPFTKLRALVLNVLVKGILAPIPRARRAASKGI